MTREHDGPRDRRDDTTAPPPPWPVVLVHGTRTSGTQWDPQIPFLRAAGHHVVTPDLPGHGSRRGGSFSLEAATTVIEEAVERVAAETDRPVHLVGSSLGGMLAIHAAARIASRSGPLGSLIGCGAAVQPTPRTARLYALLVGGADLVPALGTGTRGWPFTWLLGAEGARAYLRGGRAEIDVVAPAFAAVAALDLQAELRRIPVPVTFLHGRHDQLRVHERAFTAAAPRGRLELLPYGNHMINLNRSARFNADLLRVLARAEREQPGRAGSRIRAPRPRTGTAHGACLGAAAPGS